MTSDLTISGGGSFAVATVELFENALVLYALAQQLDHCVARLERINCSVPFGQLYEAVPMPYAAAFQERTLRARWTITLAAAAARALTVGLFASAELYGVVERRNQQFAQQVSGRLVHGLGEIFPQLALLFGPVAAPLAAGAAHSFASAPQQRRERLIAWLLEQNEMLANPMTVMLLRLGVTSADDFAAGAAGVNPIITELLGDEGMGLLGLTASAGTVVRVSGPLGALRETPVQVTRVSTRTGRSAARSYEERAERIPSGDAQIRIDKHQRRGEPDSFTVYLGGTRDLGVKAMTEPWDMTSNVNALAMGDAGSYRATKEAMRLAGIDASSPVQFVGYSQGGLIAAALAGSGDYNTQGMLTVGGVVSEDLVPQGVDWLAIEHSDDIMPALGGNRTSLDTVVVRREVFGGQQVPSETLLPAHELSRYRETAAMLDGRHDGKSTEMLRRLNEIGAGATTVTSTRYLARRSG